MLYQDVLKGNIRATAKLIRKIDDRSDDYIDELKAIYPETGKAFIIGITGNPGAGKSTLVNQLIKHFRSEDKKVGVVAIDPTSPFSGGAILGDRIRMQKFFTDEKVFIRSVATRGNLGGLSRSTYDIIKVLDAMGNDVIIVETVGVGQDEVDICKVADISVVVLIPGMGDHIQAIKAGILEIADLFVVNKCDLPGVDKTIADIEYMLSMDKKEFKPQIIKVSAEKGEGIRALVDGIYNFKNSNLKNNNKKQCKIELFNTLNTLIQNKVEKVLTKEKLNLYIEELSCKKIDPYSLSEDILSKIFIKE